MTKPAASIDLAEADRFLRALDPQARTWTFQTFDDDEKRGDRRLARILHGTLDQHAAALSNLSRLGAGVFVTVNETDGKGRTTANITRVRAVFVDLDGAPLEPCLQARLKPHIVVESSPGRWHVYLRVAGMALDQFTNVQKALISHFSSDPSVHDLPRVMRLPGFPHQKAKPFVVRLVNVHESPPYPAANFESRPTDATQLAPPIGDVVTSPGRHEALTSVARTLSARGVCREAIVVCLTAINQYQCRPPLAGVRLAEITKIADWAVKQPVLSPMTEDDDVTVTDEILNMSVDDIAAAMQRMNDEKAQG